MPEPQRGVEYTYTLELLDSGGDFVVDPAFVAGDVQVSQDGGAYANVTNLPTVAPSGSADVYHTLTATEMDGDIVKVRFSDQSSDWSDVIVTHETGGTLDSVIEGTYTLSNMISIIAAAVAGKLSGATTATGIARNITDTRDQVTYTLDGDGNRTDVVYDVDD